MKHAAPRTFALVGPGRAGTTVALALLGQGWRPVGVTGRSVDAPSTRRAVAQLGCPPAPLPDAGRGAELVLIATPDAEIEPVASALGASLEPGALVVHLSGARGVDALAAAGDRRPDVEVGALHPLQTLAAPDPVRLVGAWAAVEGPPAVHELALALGMRPFGIASEYRATYHAAAVVASNHLVALLGQVERLATAAGVPPEAFLPLVRATVANVETLGPARALTGPVARGDVATVAAHLDVLPAEERDAYRALAAAALLLSGRDDADLGEVLGGVPA